MLTATPTTAVKEQAKHSIKCLWRSPAPQPASYDRGAMDAYYGRKPERVEVEYLKGYGEQVLQLPTDEHGRVEWFRFQQGSWKLTDNI